MTSSSAVAQKSRGIKALKGHKKLPNFEQLYLQNVYEFQAKLSPCFLS